MTGNRFGSLFQYQTWGESHGGAIGCVVDGVPPRIPLCEKDIQYYLDKRRPGQSRHTSQRKESDTVKIMSGVFEGQTTGTPISLIIENEDARSKDYSEIKDKLRPGHADFTYQAKYGIRDYRGGGRSSARETAMRVAAGAIARKILQHDLSRYPAGRIKNHSHEQDLKKSSVDDAAHRDPRRLNPAAQNRGDDVARHDSVGDDVVRSASAGSDIENIQNIQNLQIRACTTQIGICKINRSHWSWNEVNSNPFWCPDETAAKEWEAYLDSVRKKGSSVGAVVEIRASGFPAGLGAPVYDKLDADLAKAMMSINAAKGVEIGNGFSAVELGGEQNADEIRIGENGAPEFQSNNAGGILGGISTGQDIVVRLAIKPTSSILTPVKTIDIDGNETDIVTKGRHDPCVGIRAVPVAEAMMACVLADHWLRHKAQCL